LNKSKSGPSLPRPPRGRGHGVIDGP